MNYIDDYDYVYKVVLIGDSGVGKTNLMTQYARNEFNLHSKSTIGVEFMNKTIEYDNNIIKIQIWDTAGQERYRALTSAYFRGASGVVLLYDITHHISFENITKIWIPLVKSHLENIPIILIGNKSDLEEFREVKLEESEKCASINNLLFTETSSKDNIGIEDAFYKLIEKMYKKDIHQMESVSTIFLTNNLTESILKQSKGCC
jgi:small GTP-binding protein